MKMRHLLAAAALSIPSLLPAQVVYEATYSVQQRGKDIGTEHVILRNAPGTAGTSGLRLEFEGTFPGSQETLRAAQRGIRIYITGNSAQGSRGGKEIPGGAGVILLDQQLQALLLLLADQATTTGIKVTAVDPRTGQRANITARRVEGGPRGTVVELTGDLTGRMQLDANGRVDRMDLPQSGIVVTRLPS